jgi:drug/metabolite transporter (DMT)-like permease
MLLTYAKLIAVPAIWGGTFIAGRIASAHLPPLTSGFIRFVFACIALLIALQFSEGLKSLKKVTPRQWLGTAALGATGIWAYNVLFFSALVNLPASRTALFVALNPGVTVILAWVVMGEKLTFQKIIGILLALLGVWIVITKGDLSQVFTGFGKGEAMMMGAVTAWAVYTLISRRVLASGLSSLQVTTMAALWGMLFLGIGAMPGLSLNKMTSAPYSVWLSLSFLGVMGTAIAFVWYGQALQKLGAARTVVFNNLVPVFGVFFGWLLLNESLSVSLLLGGALAVVGVFIVNRP